MDFDKCVDIDTSTNVRYLNKFDINRNTISIDNTNAFSIIHIKRVLLFIIINKYKIMYMN